MKQTALKSRLNIFALISLLVFMLLPLNVKAAQSRVIDDLGYLTSDEIYTLEQKTEEFTEKYGVDVFVIINDEYGFSSNYARDFIEDYGVTNYPDGYVGFIVNMADRSYWLDAYGDYPRSIISQSAADSLADHSYECLKDGDYYRALYDFVDGLDKKFEIKTTPFGFVKKLWFYPVRTLILTVVAIVAALGTALGMTFFKARKHKDKKLEYQADLYKNGYERLPGRDQFIRFYETRVRKAESSSHGGGGGGSSGHTGSGGHF